MINRIIELPEKQSFFLFGPRQTGKSTLVHKRFGESIWKVDLLLSDHFFKYTKDPSLFRMEAIEKIKNEGIQIIFVDEVQRVPLLLNEIQSLMNDFDSQFILSGSSARKLKRGGANLLAGRAVVRYLFPFVYEEISESFQLENVLQFGTLPALDRKDRREKMDILSAYAQTYLREEIQAEGIVRNLGGFSRFLDLAASQSGELVSFSSIARECHLPVKTVQSYYEILEDTLVAYRLEPWAKSMRRRLVAHPKFYFFDLGVTNALTQRLSGSLDMMQKGRLFEQFIVLETYRHIRYKQSEANIFFWRTNHGAEVDLIIEKHGKICAAIEVKLRSNPGGNELSGLKSFREEFPESIRLLVSTAQNAYELDGIRILPWQIYLKELNKLL